jgi:hypothetical protein
VRTSILITAVVVLVAGGAAVASSGAGLPNLGTPTMATQHVYKGYYDHHIDTFLLTDVSNKT